MTIPTAAEIEAIRARDAIAHHPDRVADSGKIHVFGDYLEAAEAGIADRHRLLAALDAVSAERDKLAAQAAPVVLPSIPVDLAAKVVSRVLTEALSGQGRFQTDEGYTRWGLVEHVFQEELEKASSGQTMEWRGEQEPEDARKVRLLDRACRKWPEPAFSEAIMILAGLNL